MKIKIKKLNNSATIPTQGSEKAAGYDLYACLGADEAVVYPHTTLLIKTGVAMEIPEGYFGGIYARSGLSSKKGLRPGNCVGVIDSDYRGEIKVRYITDGFVHVDTRTTKYYATYTRNSQGVNVAATVSTHNGSPRGSAPSAQTIREIQSTLNERYSVGLDVDGIYGAKTKMGLIRGLQIELNKQHHANLVVDGYWGPKTKAACPVICGGSGAIQYLIQAGLYCISGFTSLIVNGEFTADTINAVKTFQARKNLSPVDGRIGPDTFAALFG